MADTEAMHKIKVAAISVALLAPMFLPVVAEASTYGKG